MRGLIEFLARNLVDDPAEVRAQVLRDDRYATVLRLQVGPEDLGKVIGRQGRVAKSMRTLMRAAGALQGKRHVGLEIDDRGSPPPSRAAEPAGDAGPDA